MALRPGPAVGFCFGLALCTALAPFWGPRWVPPLLTSLLAGGMLNVLLVASRSAASAGGRNAPVPPVAGFLAGLCAGAVLGAPLGVPRLGIPLESVREFSGVAVSDSVARSGGGQIHRLRLDWVAEAGGGALAPARGTARVFAAGTVGTHLGQRVTVSARLAAAEAPSREAFVSRAASDELRPGGFALRVLELRSSMRRRVEERVRQMGEPVSVFFLALFLGDRSDIPEELGALFRDAGALHALALSGAHLAVVYALVGAVLRPIPRPGMRRGVGLAVLALYLFLAGPIPSLVRAGAMLAVSVLLAALDRSPTGLELLALAGSVVILLEPRIIFDLSFQLSFCAVLGIVTVGGAVADRWRAKVPAVLALPVAASLGAQAAVAPILLASSGAFQPIGLVSGLVVAPLAMGFLGLGIVDLALPLWLPPGVHAVVGALLYGMERALEACLRFFARFPPSRSWLAVLAVAALPAAACLGSRSVQSPVLRVLRWAARRRSAPGAGQE